MNHIIILIYSNVLDFNKINYYFFINNEKKIVHSVLYYCSFVWRASAGRFTKRGETREWINKCQLLHVLLRYFWLCHCSQVPEVARATIAGESILRLDANESKLTAAAAAAARIDNQETNLFFCKVDFISSREKFFFSLLT